jgi:hypothetical protein
MEKHPLERFDPLLRNMLAWGLVEEGPDGQWVLRSEVGQRLARLAQLTHRAETSAIVYFGHPCASCQASGATRLCEGRYLCDECRQAPATPSPVPEERGQRRWPHLGRRTSDIAS